MSVINKDLTQIRKRQEDSIAKRFEKRQSVIELNLAKAAKGTLLQEASEEEKAAFLIRESDHKQRAHIGLERRKKALTTLERTIGESNDILNFEFLEEGLKVGRCIGRINTGSHYGTGFLIGQDIVATNYHVVPFDEVAMYSILEMNYEDNDFGAAKVSSKFQMDPERFAFYDKKHDLAMIAVKPIGQRGVQLSTFGFLPLIKEQGKIRTGDPVNMIHHANGDTKRVVVHNSHFIYEENLGKTGDLFCWYTTDTNPGSSGAPVFNNHWEVIALHHGAVPKNAPDSPNSILLKDGTTISAKAKNHHLEDILWIANEGIRTSKIVDCLHKAEFDNTSMSKIRDDLLKLWDSGDSKLESTSLQAHGESQMIHLPIDNDASLSITINVDHKKAK